MKQTLIQSIHLCLAAGNGCEVWHPEIGLRSIFRVEGNAFYYLDNGTLCGVDIHSCGGWKIIRKPFSALVAEVEADPVDNAAVRAFDQFCPDSLEAATMGSSIDVGPAKNQSTEFEIFRDWLIESNLPIGYEVFLSLLSEGYPAGLPRDHWISREEVEGVGDG